MFLLKNPPLCIYHYFTSNCFKERFLFPQYLRDNGHRKVICILLAIFFPSLFSEKTLEGILFDTCLAAIYGHAAEVYVIFAQIFKK